MRGRKGEEKKRESREWKEAKDRKTLEYITRERKVLGEYVWSRRWGFRGESLYGKGRKGGKKKISREWKEEKAGKEILIQN